MMPLHTGSSPTSIFTCCARTSQVLVNGVKVAALDRNGDLAVVLGLSTHLISCDPQHACHTACTPQCACHTAGNFNMHATLLQEPWAGPSNLLQTRRG